MMAEIGVHVEHVAVAVLDGVLHAGDGGRAQAQLARAVQAVQPRLVGRLLVAPLAGAVGRVVVDHQHIDLRRDSEKISSTSRGRFSISLYVATVTSVVGVAGIESICRCSRKIGSVSTAIVAAWPRFESANLRRTSRPRRLSCLCGHGGRHLQSSFRPPQPLRFSQSSHERFFGNCGRIGSPRPEPGRRTLGRSTECGLRARLLVHVRLEHGA